jgi:hypothetical protein
VDEQTQALLERMEAKIDSLEARLASAVPMTPGRAAAEARAAMIRGYQAEADAREAAREQGEGGEE